MRDDQLLSIGAFSVLVGLSVSALRHYDDVGVLTPFHVDPSTSYRYYHHTQARAARTIRALRRVDLPIDELRDVVRLDDPDHLRNVLVRHRARLAERADVLAQQLQELEQYIDQGAVMTPTKGSRIAMVNIAVRDLDVTRAFYEEVFDAEFAEETHEGTFRRHLQASFGTWGEDTFFLVQFFEHEEHAGTGNIGFLVDDLDAAYARALAAGAKDDHGPMDLPGMPRVAQVWDPSGNAVGLYQAGR